jgi:hypothetical protein
MAVLTLQRRYQYGDRTKGHPPESLKPNCRKKLSQDIPYDIYRISIVANV